MLAGLCLTSALAVAEPVSVTDGQGKSLSLKKPAARVISLAPSLTEIVFDLGAERTLIGAIAYDDHPPGPNKILSVGSVAGLNYERILKLKPDLVLAWLGGTPKPWIDRLRELGVAVFVSRTNTLEQIGVSVEKMARLLDADANKLVKQYQRQLGELTSQYQNKTPVRVFYQIWAQPLMSMNDKHVIADALRVCGATNVFADAGALVPRVGVEAVLAANPQVIATAVTGGAESGKPDGLKMWAPFSDVPAVRDQRYVVLNADVITRPTPRILSAVAKLCEGIETARD